MDEWERLEREATAGPWRECLCGRPQCPTIWNTTEDPVPPSAFAVNEPREGAPSDAALLVYLRNRSPQLRAVVEAARNLAAARKTWNATPAGTAAEGAASRATDHAMHQVFDALKALDEVGHA